MSSKLKKLGTLADVYQSEHLDGTITKLKMDRIHPSSDQPRRDRFHGVKELAASIKKDGLLSPLVVTRDGEGYRIIAGERRFHAMEHLGWSEAECRIISREERDYYRIAIIENLQRENLSPEEEAEALHKLKNQEGYSDSELASLVGKSRNYITEILGIASLPPEVHKECREAGIENKNMMIQVVQAFKKGSYADFIQSYRDGTIKTVRQARDFVQKRTPEEPEEKGEGAPEISETKSSSKIAGEGDSLFEKDPPAWKLEIKGSRVIIQAPSARMAKQIEKMVREKFKEIP